MKSAGKLLLSSLLSSEKGSTDFIRMNLKKDFFVGTGEQDAFEYVEEYIGKHGTLPTIDTVELETDTNLPKAPEPASYYLEKVEARYNHRSMKSAMLDAEERLKAKDSLGAKAILRDVILTLEMAEKRNQVIDFATSAADMVKQDYKQKWLQGDDYGIKLGWETLDKDGGLVEGDVAAIVGRPAQGKTWKLLHSALHAWKHQGKIPMIVSMEMKPMNIVNRLASMLTHVPSKQFKTGDFSDKMKKKVFNALEGIQDGNMPPFYVIDGNLTASVKDIALQVRQLGVDSVYVDGAYMLQPDRYMGRFEAIANTCDGLKQRIAGDLLTPVVASYQFNREATKQKAPQDAGLEHIGGSDTIAQIATIVLGLFEEETVENFNKKYVRILKGRNGETGGYYINWLFEQWPYMDFSEIVEKDEKAKELEY